MAVRHNDRPSLSPPPTLPETATPTPRHVAWTLADVVDFDHYLATAAPDQALEQRLGEGLPAGAPDPGTQRRALFHRWLALQRERDPHPPTPGQRLQQAITLTCSAATALGVLLGAGLAGTWLAHGGDEPVNAPLFWAATVGLQLLLLLAAALGGAWRLRTRSSGGLAAALQGLLHHAALRLSRLPGERRQALRAALGRFAQRRGPQRALLAAPALALAQRFALGFNAGLLAAMLALHLPLVDLRFGWQSSYELQPAQVHAALQAIAMPWRWALPQAQPELADVQATRYTRGQPAHTLPAAAARAWWPFLALSIACYGLGLRLLLLALLQWLQRRRLAALRFDSPEAHALWRRLSGPLLRSERGSAQLPADTGRPTARRAAAQGTALAWIAQEAPETDEAVCAALQQRLGLPLAAPPQRVRIDDRTAAAPLFDALAQRQPKPALLALVVPAARDPIVAVALFLRALLQAAGAGVEVLVLLAGADDERLAIWRRFVQGQQLRLGVEAL